MVDQDNDLNVIESSEGKLYILLDFSQPTNPDGIPIPGPTAFLGKGQFGKVFVAMTEEKIPVAAKLLTLDKSSPQFQEQMAELNKECSIMQRLGGRADLIILPGDKENEVKIYVMQDLLVGISLESYFRSLNEEYLALSPNDDLGRMRVLLKTVNAFIASCEALSFLHEKGVIHGDLHTNNILYNPETREARILDFGMSQVLAPNETKVYVPGSGDMAGIHRAPETIEARLHRKGQDQERVYDKSSDLFSLAINFSIQSDITEYMTSASTKREMGQLLQLCYDLSRSNYIQELLKEQNISQGEPLEQRITLDQADLRLKGIQAQIQAKIAQQTIAPISEALLQAAIKLHRNKRSLSERSKKIDEVKPKRLAPLLWSSQEEEIPNKVNESGSPEAQSKRHPRSHRKE